MKRKVKRRGYLKERIVMAACAVTVLSALTAAGLWMREDDKGEDQGYVVDLSEIENSTASGGAAEGEVKIAQNVTEDAVTSDDLDYDPYFQETNSVHVENPDQSESESMSEGTEEEEKKTDASEKEETVSIAETEDDTPAISTAMQPTLSFSDNDSLVWPVVGNILINYSMDKTIYFPTLDQYKYNPALVIQGKVNDKVCSVADGKVSNIEKNEVTGLAVTVDLGDGYSAVYGQLKEVPLSAGDHVNAKDVIGYISEPTKYYSVEGPNLYFQMIKDNKSIDPMEFLQ